MILAKTYIAMYIQEKQGVKSPTLIVKLGSDPNNSKIGV